LAHTSSFRALIGHDDPPPPPDGGGGGTTGEVRQYGVQPCTRARGSGEDGQGEEQGNKLLGRHCYRSDSYRYSSSGD